MKHVVIIPLILLSLLWCMSTRGGREAADFTRIFIEHGGMKRSCLLHVPPDTSKCPCPLVFALHGGGGTAAGMVKLTKGRFNELADERGFYVAYPSGVRRGWNDFRNDPISYAHREHLDDVGFISALIDRLEKDYPIDKNRVFVTGISNGGFMSYRLACELSDKIRGIAAVAATHPVDQKSRCLPKRPVSVLIMNGTEDPLVPYNGGEVTVFRSKRGRILSTDDTVRFWTDFDGCPKNPVATNLPDTDPDDGTRVKEFSYGPCSGGTRVVLYRIEGGGHTWPGGVQYLFEGIIGRTSRDFNACDRIWSFFHDTAAK